MLEVECNKILKYNGPEPGFCIAFNGRFQSLNNSCIYPLLHAFPPLSPRLCGVCIELLLPVGTHKYMFIVDGEIKLDPSNTLVSHCYFIDSCMCLESQQENLLPGT